MSDPTRGPASPAGGLVGRRRLLAGAGAVLATLAAGRSAAAVRCTPFDRQGWQLCEGGIPSTLAGQSARPQYRSQWCWAACISMVFGYYGHPVSQDRIVGETFGSVVDMPADTGQILAAVNRPWTDDRRRPFQAVGRALPIDAQRAARHLIDEQPLIIGSLGHATVLTAMNWRQAVDGRQALTAVVVRDPWQGGRRRLLSGPEVWATDFLALVVARGA